MIFLVFCGIFLMMNWVTVNIYLFVWDAMMLATACGYLKRENEAFLRKILRVSLISAVAYVLVRIVRGNIFSWSLEGRSWVFYALTVIAVGLVTVFFVSLWKYRKSGNMESGQETSGKEGTGDGVTEMLLKSRKHDLKRVETYLEQVHIVGINGEWGTGKTFLMEEFCRKHGEEYEFVRVDLLTCNLDQVDVFLLQEMEAILRKHRIYPRYSRSLCNMMKDHSWLKDLRELLRMDNEVKAVVFDGFRQDMKKLGKPVVVIVEDLDRVADGKVIRKILDLTERLSCDWIKVVMEYDVENLKELGFDRKYIEKYIPYVVNLTEISLQSLLKVFWDTRKNFSKFHFLYLDVFMSENICKCLGIPQAFAWQWERISVRKVKVFLKELTIAMENLEGMDSEYWKTEAAFLAMKHFSSEIYEELSFQEDFIEELRFGCPWGSERYNLMELFALRRWNDAGKEGGLSLEQTRQMFMEDSEMAKENRQKLCLLCSMDYNIYVMDEEKRENRQLEAEKGGSLGEKRLEHRYTMETWQAEQLNRNEKVSRLIVNLYANGRSELTDAEKNAEDFIREVLMKEPEQQEEAWRTFGERTFQEEYEKEDNGTIFRWGGNHWIELAQALCLFMKRKPQGKAEAGIWLKFNDFCCRKGRLENQITPEYIRWCNYIKLDKKEVFLDVIRRFCGMEVVGNLNTDKEYIKFLRNSFRYGYFHGYFSDYEDWKLELPEWNPEMAEYVKEILQGKAKKTEQEAVSGIYGELASEELKLVGDFLKKNIQVIEAAPEAQKHRHTVKMETRTRWEYLNEEAYQELERLADRGVTEAEYRKILQDAYGEGKISLAEMRRLLQKFQK